MHPSRLGNRRQPCRGPRGLPEGTIERKIGIHRENVIHVLNGPEVRKRLKGVGYCSILGVVLGLILGPSVVDACPQRALAPHAQWKLEAQNGVSWLLTPCGDHFLSIGVNVVNGGYPMRLFERRVAYHWGTFYLNLETWSESTRRRLLGWGCNTAGAWSLDALRLPVIPDLELGRQARFHWFDPFDPSTDAEMHAWAHKLVAPTPNGN